jgi:sporulation protein YqfC
MRNKKNNRISNKLNNILEVPRELTDNNPKITIIGFDEMLIENYKGILEYEEFYIKISTELGNININGFNLGLEQVTEDDISVKGKIESLDIERTIDD